MNINERIRYLRKEHLKMNQTDFALLLGMKQTSVSSFEKNGATVTDQTIKGICFAVQNLNEAWLRNGEEPMFIENDSVSIDNIIKQKGADELEISIIRAYFELDPELRSQILKHFKGKFSAIKSQTEMAEDEYIKSRSSFAQNMDSSASNITSEKNNA